MHLRSRVQNLEAVMGRKPKKDELQIIWILKDGETKEQRMKKEAEKKGISVAEYDLKMKESTFKPVIINVLK